MSNVSDGGRCISDLGGVADVNRRFPEVRMVAWIISDSPELSMQLLEAGATALLQNNCGK